MQVTLLTIHVNPHIYLDKEVKDPSKENVKAACNSSFFFLSIEEFIVTVHAW